MKFLRNLWRWVIFPLVCLVTLIALIIAEENLRGKLAWERCKRDLEAQGEHLDMAWFIPPPVPDDQNFAMIPLLKPLFAVLKTGQPDERAHFQLFEKIRFYGGYDPKVASPQGKMGGWQTGNPSDLDAWPAYYRAAFPKMTLAQSAPEDVLIVTDQLDGILAELREGAKTRPFSRFNIQYEKGPETTLQHLAPLQTLVVILSTRATAELRLNRAEDAFEDVQLAFHLIDATRKEPFIISGLVRIGQTAVLMGPVWEGIATHRWTDGQLMALQTDFEQMDWLSDYCRAIRCERAMGYQTYKWSAEDPHEGRWGVNYPFSASGLIFRLGMKLLSGWIYQNVITQSRLVQEIISSMDPKTQRVDVPLELQAAESLEQDKSTPYNFMAKPSAGFANTLRKFALAQVWANEADIACAIERYRLAHGALPASLDELHMANMPHDVINGEPLHYRITGGDDYILYSVGWNGTDDGGEIVTKENGSVDFTKGDWVWSVAPVEVQKN